MTEGLVRCTPAPRGGVEAPLAAVGAIRASARPPMTTRAGSTARRRGRARWDRFDLMTTGSTQPSGR